jgi:hypothetical protein
VVRGTIKEEVRDMGIRGNGASFVVFTAGTLALWAVCPLAAAAASATAVSAGTATACPHVSTATPVPASLRGVAALSPSDAWSVGWTSGGAPRPVLAHWNGSSWTTVSSSVLQAPGVLLAVAKSPGGVWAVGASGQAAGGQHRTHFILRVNGLTVRTVPAPGPVGGKLEAVAATSATDAWAVGYVSSGGPLILHWNGTTWKRSPLPARDGRMYGVAATSATNAWAILTSGRADSQIWHWNGKSWGRVPIPAIAGRSYDLAGVSAISAKNAWAVGGIIDSSIVGHTVILHWNGARWRRMPSPNPPAPDGDFLDAVSASSVDNAWAVGTSTSGPSLTEHWDGTSWRAVPAPGCAVLAGVSVLPSGRAWAVGSRGNRLPVILRWNGTRWRSTPLN